MFKIASFDLTDCLDIDIQHIYQNSTVDLWLLKSKSGLENEKDLVYKVSNFLKDKNIKLELVTNDLDIISDCLPDCLAVPNFLDRNKNREAIKVASIMNINTIAVFFDDIDIDKTLDTYKEVVYLIKTYKDILVDIRCSYQSPSLFLNKNNDLNNEELKRLFFYFVPLCLSNKYSINADFGRIIEIYNKECGFNKRSFSDQISEMGKISTCSSCISRSKCFGFLKTNKNILSEVKKFSYENKSLNNTYVSPGDCFLNKEFKISHNILSLSKDNYRHSKVYSDLTCLQDFRLYKSFKNNNFIDIVKFDDPVAFIRKKDKEDIISFNEERQMLSINLKYLGLEIQENKNKLSHDKLLGTGSFAVLSKIKFSNHININIQKKLDSLINNSILELIKLYGDASLISTKGQDIYYNGKRLYGREWKFIPDVGLVSNCFINCNIIKDKESYDIIQANQMDNDYCPVFTGLSNEFQELTFNKVLNFVSNKISDFIEEYNECY